MGKKITSNECASEASSSENENVKHLVVGGGSKKLDDVTGGNRNTCVTFLIL